MGAHVMEPDFDPDLFPGHQRRQRCYVKTFDLFMSIVFYMLAFYGLYSLWQKVAP